MVTEATADLVGRGNREGAALFRDWFEELDTTAASGGQAAYVFVMGSINEILKAFDLPVVFPEINSLQTAVRRVLDTQKHWRSSSPSNAHCSCA